MSNTALNNKSNMGEGRSVARPVAPRDARSRIARTKAAKEPMLITNRRQLDLLQLDVLAYI